MTNQRGERAFFEGRGEEEIESEPARKKEIKGERACRRESVHMCAYTYMHLIDIGRTDTETQSETTTETETETETKSRGPQSQPEKGQTKA